MTDWKAIRERQEAKRADYEKTRKAAEREARKQARWAREGRKERAYLDALTSDHNHELNG